MNRDELAGIAARLEMLRSLPLDVLTEVVTQNGRCLWEVTEGDPPEMTGNEPDRELAAQLCANCPVRNECLELEFRSAGAETVGVWGALSEEDRRALYPMWRARREAERGEWG